MIKKWLGSVLLLAASGALAAAQASIEPDDFAPGDDISNAVPGVTLSTVSSNHGDPRVFAAAPAAAGWTSTGALAFTHLGPFAQHWVTDTTPEFQHGALRADFSGFVPRVEIDLIGNDTFGDVGVLRAFDAAGGLLQEVQTAVLLTGQIERLVVEDVGGIAYIVAGGLGTDTVGLDYLTFVPEPAGLAALVLVAALRRRR